ncbi:MAG: DNA topoisomerase, partial [Chthoniobacteraceae bacterium]
HDFVTECTIMDSVLTIMKDGTLKVAKVADKVFMGREIIHISIWPKDGDTNFYTMVYQDGESGKALVKKFQIGGLARDKLYPLAKSEKSRVIYLKISPTEEAIPKSLHVSLDGRSGARVRELDFDLSRVPVSSRSSKGLTITKWAVKDVTAKK